MIADILGVQKSTVKNVVNLNEKLRLKAPQRKRAPGVAREVLQLYGASLTSLPVHALGSTIYDASGKRSVPQNKWVWCSFRNSAHPSGVHLHQWCLESEAEPVTVTGESKPSERFDNVNITAAIETSVPTAGLKNAAVADTDMVVKKPPPEESLPAAASCSELPLCCTLRLKGDYPAAAFNKKTQVPRYTNSVYQKLIANLSSNWSRWETDYLFYLCVQFDLRFVIIYDRYAPVDELTRIVDQRRKQQDTADTNTAAEVGGSAEPATDQLSSARACPGKESGAKDPVWVTSLANSSLDTLKSLLAEVSSVNPRSIEQLKERYYSAAKRLVEHEYQKKLESLESRFAVLSSSISPENVELLTQQRTQLLIETKSELARHPLVKFHYDQALDMQRREYLDRQYKASGFLARQQREADQDLVAQVVKSEMISRKVIAKKEDNGSSVKRRKTTTSVTVPSVKSEATQDISIPVQLMKNQLLYNRKPGPILSSQMMQMFAAPLLLQNPAGNATAATGSPAADRSAASGPGAKKHDAKIEAELKALGFGTAGCPLWPSYCDREVLEAFNALRIDVAVMINYNHEVDQLLKEKNVWKAKITQLKEEKNWQHSNPIAHERSYGNHSSHLESTVGSKVVVSDRDTYIEQQVKNFPNHLHQLKNFLAEFAIPQVEPGSLHGGKKYLNQLYFSDGDADASNPDSTGKLDPLLPYAVETNCLRYSRLLYDAAEEVKNKLAPPTDTGSGTTSPDMLTHDQVGTFDEGLQNLLTIIIWSCLGCTISQPQRGAGQLSVMEAARVPVHLRVSYELRVVPASDTKPLSVRGVRSAHIGSLVVMDAIVTKVSSVKPRLVVAHYKCLDCGSDAHQTIEGPSFSPLLFCQSQACVANQKKGELRMVLPDSKFVKYQEVRVQEPSNRVPAAAIPRTQKIIVEGSLTRKLVPGMVVSLAGIPAPAPKMGYQALRQGLCTDTTFLVTDVQIHKQVYDEHFSCDSDPDSIQKLLEKFQDDPYLYEKLARSIAPSIHGLEDVKKALLLQLIGGTTETFPDGMKLRGDIHVLLMGDPGVAKSQLLGQICRIAQRAHYTTGKGSSGVGLTASVVRDPITGDFALEGGAIVLSDRGICCIDEFDKMDEYDRTAIHEVMEQQTVSISKAGLTTTLNARTSILAAANPQYGRYDIKKSTMQNINLPAALLSRFDVQFLLLDRADREADLDLAKHVLRVHQQTASATENGNESGGRQNESEEEFLDGRTIRLLIAKAKTFQPKLPQSLMKEIVEYYVDLRQRERVSQSWNETSSYTTPRTLFAILRLSQALARLRFSNLVERGDFEEALRLVHECQRSVLAAEESAGSKRRNAGDFQSEIIEMLKDMDKRYSKRAGWDGWLSMIEVGESGARIGFDLQLLMKAIHAYEELDVLQWKNDNKSHVAFCERLVNI